ncbi:MAG: GTPase [Parasynechococcus sp.]
MAPSPPATTERCRQLLQSWRRELQLNRREQGLLRGELTLLDRQLQRLDQRVLRIAVFGRVGVGKSSLINALVGQRLLETDVAHGSTRRQQAVAWPLRLNGLERVELIDTPGIDEIDAAGRTRLATRVAMGVDLVLLVIDSDLTRCDRDALETLQASGKPVRLVLNRSDRWPEHELPQLLTSIRSRLPRDLPLTAVAAAPRRPVLDADGRVRSAPAPAQVSPLKHQLTDQLDREGELVLALQSLRQADRFQQQRQQLRLQQHRRSAQGLIGRYAATKATAVAMNPLMALDLAGGLACDTGLVLQLCQLYGLPLTPSATQAAAPTTFRPERPAGGRAAGAGAAEATVAAAGAGERRGQPGAGRARRRGPGRSGGTRQPPHRGPGGPPASPGTHGGQPGALLQRLEQRDPVVRHWMQRWQGRRQPDWQPLLP